MSSSTTTSGPAKAQPMSASYAGNYVLRPASAGWWTLYAFGREVGAWCGCGGVYAAAQHFGV